jgi:small subunit ribosomal protein S7
MRVKKNHVRSVEPDQKYNSEKIQKLINRSMIAGKKSIAQAQIYRAMELIGKKLNGNPVDLFEQALNNIAPKIEVRSRRVGGAAYQVPMPVPPRRAASLAIRWLVNEANKRSNGEFHSYGEKLAAEIMDAVNNQGGAVQKKITAHKMAEANKAFAHFRW